MCSRSCGRLRQVYLEYTPSMFALCLFFFAVTLLMRYGTWIPNSILASVQLGAAVSSGVPQTGLLPVGSRGRLSSGIPRRRPYSTLVCGRIMLRVHLFSLRIGICSPPDRRLHWCRQLGYNLTLRQRSPHIGIVHVLVDKARGIENRHSAPC